LVHVTDPQRTREIAKERGYEVLAPIDEAYQRGEITKEEWHARVLAIIEPAYIAATTERMGSGHSGSQEDWDASRIIIMEAVQSSGTFLDVGCANGLLMASVKSWANERGLDVECYGVDISHSLAEVARQRYPQWRERIWTANADGWEPPIRFDMVRTGLEYVPYGDRRAYVRHLFDHVVAARGRLIIGKNNENRGEMGIAESLRTWGWSDVREARRPHAHPEVEATVVWVDGA
jgi:SAM-dependent methyltransferase